MGRCLRTQSSLATLAIFATLVFAGHAQGASIGPEPVATGLDFPAAFTFAPDGRIFYGERFSGEIRILNPATGSDSLFFTVSNLATTGEQGLLGLALHPDYPSLPYVFAYATRTLSGATKNHILRLTDSDGKASWMTTIFTAPAAGSHNGGRILFGPDKQLYAVVGDNGPPANAQDLTKDLGKVLRMSAWGKVPRGNPFPDSLIWAYGIRNSFGFAFDPETRRLWQTENGPMCNDELNRIVKGRNYGWGPSQTCETPPEPPLNTNQDGPNPHLPQLWYGSPIAPTGAAFCSGCDLGPWSEGRLFFGNWRSRELHRVTLGTERWTPVSDRVMYTHSTGILSLEAGPDGALYFSDPGAIHKLVLSP